jgi:hydrogenase maturation protease
MLSRETELMIKRGDAPHASSAKIVIIGFGSPIRGDDAFGPLVADRLAREIDTPQVEVLSRHILTAEMAEIVQGASLVVFIDAATIGTVGQLEERCLTPRRDVSEAIAHSVDARGLLAWTEALFGHAPPAILLSTRAVTLQYAHYQLSPAVEAAVRPTLDRIHHLVETHLQHAPRDRDDA